MNNQHSSFPAKRIAVFIVKNMIAFPVRNTHDYLMSKQPHVSRLAAYGVVAAVLLFFGTDAAQAQWAAKPAPVLPRTVLDQGLSGSVVLNLVFDRNGNVTDAQVVRGSGIAGLDRLAAEGAMNWRLAPASVSDSDLSAGRRHMIKFYQNSRVARRVEPYKAFWKEL